jgi:hypothetical protein
MAAPVATRSSSVAWSQLTISRNRPGRDESRPENKGLKTRESGTFLVLSLRLAGLGAMRPARARSYTSAIRRLRGRVTL